MENVKAEMGEKYVWKGDPLNESIIILPGILVTVYECSHLSVAQKMNKGGSLEQDSETVWHEPGHHHNNIILNTQPCFHIYYLLISFSTSQ